MKLLSKVVGGAALAGLLASCGAAVPAPQGLTVLAAASLTEVFSDLELAFEAGHPGVNVVVSTGGSQTLATQIRHGIDADVFASADARQIDALAGEGLVRDPRAFAGNALVLAVSSGYGPVDLEGLATVPRLVIGDGEVPAGRYAEALLDAGQKRYGDDWRAAVEARIASREPNVRLALTKVSLGEADVAVVYATDVIGVPGVRAVALPAELAPVASYHQAVLVAAPSPELATEWIGFVGSDEGRAVLGARGFLPAP